MTASTLFSAANLVALAGWLILAFGAFTNRPLWRDVVAGRVLPIGLAAGYTLLIVLFFGQAEGGFSTLADVQKLFSAPWVALAGWVHYLAFDLFIGAWIARRVAELQLPKLLLLVLLPLTFLFGPAGLVTFEIFRFTFARAGERS